jgi:hypothetical protein
MQHVRHIHSTRPGATTNAHRKMLDEARIKGENDLSERVSFGISIRLYFTDLAATRNAPPV